MGDADNLERSVGSVPGEERIVTIEDAAELRLRHVVRLEARQAYLDGRGEAWTGSWWAR